jgi:ribosomal protein S12 methylthiotransferase
VNTCAFIEAAREESVEAVLELASLRSAGSRLVVTGCLAERYGAELAAALPEADVVVGFDDVVDELGPGAASLGSRSRSGVQVHLGRPRKRAAAALLDLPRRAPTGAFAYVKVAEGCDRRCGFCAIPSFRGRQRSRSVEAIVAEVEALGVPEVVLVAQDICSFGLDRDDGAKLGGNRGRERPLVRLLSEVARRVERCRLLYLFPSEVDDALIEAIAATGVPYFDLSLQHASPALLRAMGRPGSPEAWLGLVERIRAVEPDATIRSSFIVGHPGETEDDHDQLLEVLKSASLDWAGFFAYSPEEGTRSANLGDRVPPAVVEERRRELEALQASLTLARRQRFVGRTLEVLVERPGEGRSVHEAPEIDGLVSFTGASLPAAGLVEVEVDGVVGVDLVGRVVDAGEVEAALAASGSARR